MDTGEVQGHSSLWRRRAVLFIISQGITLFGSSIVQMAIIWQVALETSSGFWLTVLTLSSTIPQMILSFFGGVWADRYSRKRLIILADGGIAVVTLVLALVFMFGKTATILPLLVLVSTLRSVGSGIQTPAVSAVIPQIVPEEQLIRYNGINSSMMAIVQFASPAVAGAVLSIGSFHWLLLLDVATALIGIILLSFVTITKLKKAEQSEQTFFADMKAGISYAAKELVVKRLLFTYGAFIFLSVPSSFLTVLMIERTFGNSYMYLTVNEMAGFAGMVLGGILLGTWGGFKQRIKTLVFGLVCFGIFSLVLGFTYTFWLFAVMMFLMSFFIPVVQTATTTMLQEHVPAEKQGRIFGLLGAMYSGFMPLGTAIFGPLADVIKIQWLVIGCGVSLVILGLLRFFHSEES
ncbi:MFS transporter [Enterococcus hulanensis]|uniref:MFS transporter n=1 Tax=Enterococcus hulanensis TaxID=2559929 RepID=A0ABU3EUW0_9ENTE|nr:MFS transporter [Enterococcus hulanensis]MDT2598446.1 MFS transporter [Enterococcus hulanensis]MDT2608049.1 MFS transporter [Enterococcus hulanensis]MDT2615344.1 MFS transporter [Enterococcus hulanensis]MDT2626685.1 MFS transporter [Enterococcus hulanensis]MDT2654416.1 MFS transporter [Enterococcus hulanensis]